MEVPILYRDPSLLVCCKRAGLLSEEGGLPDLLRAQTGAEQIFCVHRLDRAAGGVMVYAGTREAAAALSRQIAAGEFQKEYLAVVWGETPPGGLLEDLLYHDAAKNKSFAVKRMRRGVRKAALRFETLSRADSLSLVRVQLLTGRTHQIRVQFASRGFPLWGDRRYGGSGSALALWSSGLRFADPVSGEARVFTLPPPETDPWTLFPKP